MQPSRLILAATTVVARWALAAPLPYSNLAQSVLLTDAVKTVGAMCLDGTPQRYWIQPASAAANATKWTVHTMGGGWCESPSDCAGRAKSYIGSSDPQYFKQEPGDSIPGLSDYNETMDFAYIPSCLGSRWCGGLMANDTIENPLTATWNKVLLPYCDGGSFGGANMDPVVVNGQTIYYRGFINLNAVIDDLVANHNLGSATELVLSGDSAGGLATYWHVDHWQGRLPSTRVVGAPDSGYFFTAGTGYAGWSSALHWVVSAMNSSAGLNQACVRGEAAAQRDPLGCAFPEIVSPYITSPLFVLNSRFDPALDSISGGIGQNNASAVTRLGDLLLGLVENTVLNRPGNAAFLTSCAQHCGQWSQGWKLGPDNNPNEFNDFNVTLPDGTSSMGAFVTWYTSLQGGGAKPPARLWMQQAPFPCPSCCSGGNK